MVDQVGNTIQLDSISDDTLFEQFNLRLIEDECGIEELRDLIRKIFYELDESLSKVFRLSLGDRYLLPSAIFENGYGNGNTEVHNKAVEMYINSLVISESDYTKWINFADFNKLYNDFFSLIDQATKHYIEFLTYMRNNIPLKIQIMNGWENSNEVISDDSKVAGLITISIISFCSALDIAGRMSEFIHLIDPETSNSDIYLEKLNRTYFADLKKTPLKGYVEDKIFNALIKLRNDLVHNTGILEFERNCYIGFATPCVNENKLAYFYIPFRDIDDRGEAIKLHGRRFFNSQENDIDVFLSDVIKTMKLFVGDFQSYVLRELNTKSLVTN
ncbi:hypothetical protein [Sulfuricurvum sp.]|uniref:hypothetical protein n=1 Tax=Sulfuricurvum sp. TaxID=2025608 RepID=UPI002E2EE853|nr:hypothetical protein [Sulfuricurvum sp.]HEX5329165.1 hypothetical protein [Sulfuricurvum sp.]